MNSQKWCEVGGWPGKQVGVGWLGPKTGGKWEVEMPFPLLYQSVKIVAHLCNTSVIGTCSGHRLGMICV